MTRTIDINCDIGESFGNWSLGDDDALYPLITTASIACGFHAGDPLTMSKSVRLAKKHEVKVGSHPGFPDLLGFGRRAIDISPEDAAAYITYQTGALMGFLREHNMDLHHIKPHGAFYAVLSRNHHLAKDAAHAIRQFGADMKMYWPAPYHDVAFCNELDAAGVEVVGVLFPDLQYDDAGDLVLQRKKNETDLSFAVGQVRQFLTHGELTTVSGKSLAVDAQSICVHSDGPNAAEVTRAILSEIERLGMTLEAVS